MMFTVDELMDLYEACCLKFSQALNIGDLKQAETYRDLSRKIQKKIGEANED